MAQKGIHGFIDGHVQGVFFRAATKELADKLQITGWVRNTEDGGVELEAYGQEDKLLEFENWLSTGPKASHVTMVLIEDIEPKEADSFEITR